MRLYHFFLKHPEGVRLVDLRDAHHVAELTQLYQVVATKGNRQEQATPSGAVAEDVEGKLQQHLSRIRRAFRQGLGIQGSGLVHH